MSLAVQQFEGRSVEDALAAAARHLGDGLQVKSAQRVRRGGILGFFAREHYQVIAESTGGAPTMAAPDPIAAPQLSIAAPRPAPPAAASVDRVLQSLVEEVEAREMAPVLSSVPSRFTEADLVSLDPPAFAEPQPMQARDALQSRVIETEMIETEMIEMIETVEAPAAERPLRARPVKDAAALEVAAGPAESIDLRGEAVPAFYDFEVLDAQEIERAPKWTRTALREIGLPLPVLKALPQRNPTTDLAWTQALERAIAKVVPPPAALDEAHDAQVSGFGAKGAVNIIRAALSGFTPGLLQIDGRSVPATASELALGVRSCLRP